MHGRLKVRTTAEQEERKRKEREEKLKKYNAAVKLIFGKRGDPAFGEQILQASAKVLEANPDFYSLWNIRREVFTDLGKDHSEDYIQNTMETELMFLEACLKVNPKSYGCWHQRGWILDHMPRPNWDRELLLCDRYLDYDERNFHCWDYRRFLVKRANRSSELELKFTTDKIKANFSNYSSWHYRSKLLPQIYPDPSNSVNVKENVLLEEFELAQNAFFTDPSDQSAWFYHRWLLGRGQTQIKIQCVQLSANDQDNTKLLMVLSDRAKSNIISCKINGRSAELKWQSPKKLNYSYIWFAVIKECPHEISSVEVALSGGETTKLELPEGKNEISHVSETLGADSFSQELSVAANDVLSKELEACEQLYELEPENKWTLLTIVSLMRAIDSNQYEKNIIRYIEKLTALDPSRTSYYSDLRSGCIIENIIMKSGQNLDKISVNGKQLTCVKHMELFALTKKLDLSQNSLSQLKFAHCLQNVQILILDDNQISSFDDLESLPKLELLSLKNNNIESVGNLDVLKKCPNLQKLDIQGNPISNSSNLVDQLHLILPSVKIDI